MSRRLELRRHLQQLGAVKDIMNVMKDLAFMEMAKLSKRLQYAQRMVASLEQAAADFLAAYPWSWPRDGCPAEILVVFGSERGFCGDFNERLMDFLERRAEQEPGLQALLLPVGYKLGMRLQHHPGVQGSIGGAGVTEEVTGLLSNIISAIHAARDVHGNCRVQTVCHDPAAGVVVSSPLLPPFQQFAGSPGGYRPAPWLNLDPEAFYSRLVDEYLFTSLHEIAFRSLMAENQQRIQHMTAAVRRLDRSTGDMTRKYHQLYQEEITEEIEIILLNAANPGY